MRRKATPTGKLLLRLERRLHARAIAAADKRGETLTDFVRLAITSACRAVESGTRKGATTS